MDDGETINRTADEMEELTSELSEIFFRDSRSLRNSKVLLLMGCEMAEVGIRVRMESIGIAEDVALSIVNLGIALGSTVNGYL